MIMLTCYALTETQYLAEKLMFLTMQNEKLSSHSEEVIQRSNI